MCLLGVSMMNNHTYGSRVPPKNPFGGLNRHFKPNMRKNQIAISSDLCIRLTWNLTGSCGQQQRLRGWSRMVVKQFQDGGRPPFWKSIYRYISVKNHPIFMKFCIQQQILNWMNITWLKMKKLHWTDSELDRTYFVLEILPWDGERSDVGNHRIIWPLRRTGNNAMHAFLFSFFQVTTQLQYIEDSEPVVDGSRNRWYDVQWATKTN